MSRKTAFDFAGAAIFLRAQAIVSAEQEYSRTGYISTRESGEMVCPVEGTMRLISSTSSPNKSMRTGYVRLPGKTSIVPPCTAKVPGPSSSPVFA